MTTPENGAATDHPALDVARQLDARDIRGLAEAYREWRGVMAAAVDALNVRGMQVQPRVVRAIAAVFGGQDQPVPASDAEDAAMALWLQAESVVAVPQDSMTRLLGEPWRTFNERRGFGEIAWPGEQDDTDAAAS